MNLKPLNTDEMLVLENRAVHAYGVSVDTMMQKAGKALYDLIREVILTNKKAPHILVVIGKGNNGGDALVAAGRLHNDLIYTEILNVFDTNEFSMASKEQLNKCESLGVHINTEIKSVHWNAFDLIVDGLFGFSLKGDPRSPSKEVIEQILYSGIPVLSVDVPSGLDVHDGTLGSPIVKADYTLVYGMPKVGLNKNNNVSGKLYLGDLGIVGQAYLDEGYSVPNFEGKSYVSLV